MHKRECGFSLVELMVAMVVFVFVMAASSNLFLSVLQQFKQQTKTAETALEELVGLDILRRDVEHAGYGLPWVLPAGVSYTEGTGPAYTGLGAFNDSASNPPRALVAGNGGGLNGSDRLAVKAANVISNAAAHKWTLLGPGAGNKVDDLSGRPAFLSDDKMIVLEPGLTEGNNRRLVLDGSSAFAASYNQSDNFAPGVDHTNVIYGISDDAIGTPNMPFNRADYFIDDGTYVNLPTHCAPGTGVLVKQEMDPTDGTVLQTLPIVDCAADMQIGYRRDTNEDGIIDTASNTLTASSATAAAAIRDEVVEVRIYLLAHEGQRDRHYTHNTTSINLGETLNGTGIGGNTTYDLAANANYRWKVYTLVIRPNNLK